MFANLLGISQFLRSTAFGAWASLTLFSYPIFTVRPLDASDPGLEERRMLGRSSWHISQGCLATTSTSREQRRAIVSLGSSATCCGHDAVRHSPEIYLNIEGIGTGASAALGLMLVVLTITVLTGEQRLRRREDLHRLHGSGARTPQPVELVAYGFLRCGSRAFTARTGRCSRVISYWLVRGGAGEPVWPLSSAFKQPLGFFARRGRRNIAAPLWQ